MFFGILAAASRKRHVGFLPLRSLRPPVLCANRLEFRAAENQQRPDCCGEGAGV